MKKSSKPKASAKTAIKKQLVFDFETEQISDLFRHASGTDRIQFAPRLRIACVYDIGSNKYTYYEPKSAHALITDLMGADEIISFNGKNFDLFVLQRHHRLNMKDVARLNRNHIDLCEIVRMILGRRCSLDELSRLNLKERKHTNGRQMVSLNLPALKDACRSDVSQTYRLFLRWLDGSLILPPQATGRGSILGDIPLIHLHLPDPFPHRYIDQDCDDMTEGQMAEYLSGTWGILDDEDMTFVQI